MKTDDLREAYLSFFESKGCIRRPSDVLVPNDPTVLFTPAGMNQFKNEFLGLGKPDFTKATTCQKCIRTGDISNVGVTAYHHTFFEMLGNFSFGDYFKKEAIHWAWEFLTTKKWLGLNPDQLTVTVYLDDDEAFGIWEKEIGLPASRIHRCDEYENFWPAGSPTDGPDGICGPCSEIYFHPASGGKEVEIWNLVFTQFNRSGNPPNNLIPLPKKNIDTGMGLERTAAVLQGVESNFEIDTLRPLCNAVGEIIGRKYEFKAEHGRAMRRIADHVRAVTMCIHENVLPDSAKQGYIVRQLLRRAVLEGYLLGKHENFLAQLVPVVVDLLKKPYPDLVETVPAVQAAITDEETQFLNTIDRGLNRFKTHAKSAKEGVFSGDDAFNLHQTDGFLIELTEALASKEGLKVDRPRYEELMREHSLISGRVTVDAVMAEGPLDAIRKSKGETNFLGYEADHSESEIVGIISNKELVDKFSQKQHATPIGIVLDQTPFYGESGGQVGDQGVISSNGMKFLVQDTQKDGGNLWIHIGTLVEGELKVGQKVEAQVDIQRREGIRRAHSATHLLHYALHEVIGENALQRGSKVESDSLRFDFSHRQPVTDEELKQVEDIVNEKIAEGVTVTTKLLPIEEARAAGAMALFGEKYPDLVRMVSIGEFSKELCGGTHLVNSGQVGLVKIVSESGVSKGVRRIEALTGPKVRQAVRNTETIVLQLQQMLKATLPSELLSKVATLQNELAEAKEKLATQMRDAMTGDVTKLLETAETVNGTKIVTHTLVGGNKETLREFADQLRDQADSVAILLATENEGKVTLLAAVSKPLTKKGVMAGECVKLAAPLVGGGGGGKPDLAEAGGKDPAGIPNALEAAAKYYREKLA